MQIDIIKKLFLFSVFACLFFFPSYTNAKEGKINPLESLKELSRETINFYKPLVLDMSSVYLFIGDRTTHYFDKLVFSRSSIDRMFYSVGESGLFTINHLARFTSLIGYFAISLYEDSGKSLYIISKQINKPIDSLAQTIVTIVKKNSLPNDFINRSREDMVSSPISFWNSMIEKISNPLVPLFFKDDIYINSNNIFLDKKSSDRSYMEQEDVTDNKIIPTNTDKIVSNYYISDLSVDKKISDIRLEFLSLSQNLLNYVENKRMGQAERIADSSSRNISNALENISGTNIVDSTFSGTANLSDLTVDSNTLVVDSDNNRVGIATSSPFATFSVAGDIFVTGGFFDSDVSLGLDGYVLQSTGTGTRWVATSSLGIIGGSTSTLEDLTDVTSMTKSFGDLLYWDGSSWDNIATSSLGIGISQWTTSGSNIYFNTGNIGIGTTTPGQKLSVAGDILGNNIIGSYFTATSTATSTFTGGISTKLLNVTSSTASSTFANGINLNAGCFAVNGICLSSGFSNLSTFSTDNLDEGMTNLYFTDSRAITALTGQNISLFSNDSSYLTSIAGLSISDLTNNSGYITSVSGGDHGSLSGLTDDDHTQYALLAGRSGGQTLIGGIASGNNLTLRSTSHATKGKVVFGSAGTTAYDEVNNRFGVGTASPNSTLEAYSSSNFTQFRVSGAQAPGVNWYTSSSNSSARNWGIFTNAQILGDFVINQSTTNTGDPSSGTARFRINSDGRVGVGIAPDASAYLTVGGDFKSTGYGYFGTTGKFTIITDYAGFGDLPAGSFLGGQSTNGSMSFAPSSDSGTAGAKVVLGYYNGSAWKAALEYANTSGGANSTLYLMKGGGNVGIGTTTPGQKLSVAGDILGNNIIGSYFTATSSTSGFSATNLLGGATNLTVDANGNIIRDPSDRNLKENIETINGALEKVLKLRGVSYEWKDKERFGSQTEIGVIAQEVEGIIPEVISSGGEYKSVNIKNLVGLLIEAIKELANKIDSILAWFKDDKLNIKDDVCVDDVCVTKEQFKALLIQVEENADNNSGQSDNIQDDNEGDVGDEFISQGSDTISSSDTDDAFIDVDDINISDNNIVSDSGEDSLLDEDHNIEETTDFEPISEETVVSSEDVN